MQTSYVTQSESFLPLELWMNVFSHLTPKDVGVLSRVCRDFSNISCDQLLWRALAQRNYPDTYAQLSERQIVQETEGGNKRRRVGDSSEEIDWKEVCIARASFFSAAKKDQLKRSILLRGIISCFDICEKKIFAGGANKIEVFENKEVVVQIEPAGGTIYSIKVEKRKDGEVFIYTGDMKGNITSWKFDGVKFEKKKGFVENSQGNEKVLALDVNKELISLDYYHVHFWDKEEGTLLETFKHNVSQDGYSALAVTQERIFASTIHGILKIWDANTRELLQEVHDIKELNHTIHHIKIRDEKVFYTGREGIFIYDLIQKTNTVISKENLESFSFDIFDGKLFYFKKMEGSFGQGISIIDLETLTIESGPFSSIKAFDSAIKIVPQGILHCHSVMSWGLGSFQPSSGLYITQPETKN